MWGKCWCISLEKIYISTSDINIPQIHSGMQSKIWTCLLTKEHTFLHFVVRMFCLCGPVCRDACARRGVNHCGNHFEAWITERWLLREPLQETKGPQLEQRRNRAAVYLFPFALNTCFMPSWLHVSRTVDPLPVPLPYVDPLHVP